MSIPLVYSPFYSYSFPANHRFPMSKFHHLHQCLTDTGLLTTDNVFRPGRVKQAVLQLAHDKNYIQKFQNNQLTSQELRKMGLPWSEALVEEALVNRKYLC